MSSPLQQTTDVDVSAVPQSTVAESRAPAGTAGSPLPTVGTNAASDWGMWDPNLWWTDWKLPPDPRPSWELWFDWVNQLEALTPALGEASQDWQTMIGQFDDSLRSVRAMRGELSSWTGPSAQTMSQALDRLEDSITTKSAAIQDNPAKLRDLAQTINDAVPPMTALDAEYQQVLQDLNACRQVAERGKPIMLNLATKLLQAGTDLENSVRTDNLAPQPVPPQAVALTDGPQGPTQQLTQVAGSNLADPGAVTTGAQIGVADQPTTAGASGLTDPGQVQQAQQIGAAHTPGVAVGPADAGAATQPPTQPGAAAPTAQPTLAGVSAGAAAPTVPAAPVAAMPPAVAAGPVAPVAQFVAPPVLAGAPMAERTDRERKCAEGPLRNAQRAEGPPQRSETPMVVGVPVVPAVAVGSPVTGAAAVPAGLLGRAGGHPRPAPVPAGDSETAEPLDADVFAVEDAGTGTVTAPK